MPRKVFKEHSKEVPQAPRVAPGVGTSRADLKILPGAHLPILQITWTARYGSQAGDIQPAEIQQEVVVSYLPLSHIAAQIHDLWTGIQWGAQVCFAEPDALKVSLPLPVRVPMCVLVSVGPVRAFVSLPVPCVFTA